MTMYETRHFIRKLLGTVKLAATLFLARTFGHYEVSVYDATHGFQYAKYRWRGQLWAIPTKPIECD